MATLHVLTLKCGPYSHQPGDVQFMKKIRKMIGKNKPLLAEFLHAKDSKYRTPKMVAEHYGNKQM
jgi:hypothetical protein